MAAPTDLTDLFAKKKKKVFKGTNLNSGLTANKGDDKKVKTKDQEEEGWQEEQVVATTLKVEVAGNLKKEDDKKDNEGEQKAAWNATRNKGIARDEKDEKRYPTLQGAQSNIKIGAEEGKINIKTSKNKFDAFEDDDDSDSDAEKKKPTKIVPAMVQKKKGETEKGAVQREVAKYTDSSKKKKKKDKDEDEEESEEDEESEQDDEEEKAREKIAKDEAAQARKDAKKAAAKQSASKVEKKEEEEEEEVEEDCKIPVDLVKSKEKYVGRKKPFPPKPIDRSEREEETQPAAAAKAKANAGGGGKKKKFLVMEEDDKKSKLQYLEE